MTRNRLAHLMIAAALGVAADVSAATTPFALIVVPDTQNYTDFDDINETYNLGQMRWIRDNMTSMNIKFVMHLGDHQNPGNPYEARTDNIYEPDFSKPLGNATVRADKEAKWGRANDAIQVLDNNNIPYSTVPGNHDYLDHNTKAQPWLYLKTFGPQRYIDEQATWAADKRTYGGASPENPNNGYAGMNTFHKFDAGGYKFLNIALQFDPDNADMRWAQQVINDNPNLPTIITTHAYVNTKPAANDYQHADIFDKLVKNNPQIVMTFNGHLTGANYVAGTNIAGKTAHQFLVDMQASQLDAQLGDDYYRGAGTLRQLLFNPDLDLVTIKDYSVVAQRFLPRQFTAPDNDDDIATYDTPASVSLDLDGRFGLPNGAGIKQTKVFQHNVNGYTGGRDTMLDENDPDGNTLHGSDPALWVDGDRNGATTGNPDSQVLLRFDFLTDAGNLPAAAKIDKAELRLHTSDLPDSESPNTISMYRLLKPWTVNGTWNSQGDGISNDGLDAILGANDTFVPDVDSPDFLTLDVTESLAAWLAGAPNYGWAFFPGGGNGWQFDSADNATAAFRPQLTVNYTIVPEPALGVASLTLAAGALLRRRRNS